MYKYFERRSPDQPRLYRTTDPEESCECFDCGHSGRWEVGFDLVTTPEGFREITAFTAQSWYPAAFSLPPTPPLDLTKPVQTRDGRAVILLSTNRKAYFSVVGIVAPSQEGEEEVTTWTSKGEFRRSGCSDSQNDLVNVPPPAPPKKHSVTAWVNIYEEEDMCDVLHSTKKEADKGASDGRVACIPVMFEYTEGEGLL